VRRQANTLFEHPREVVFAELALGGQVGQLQWLIQMAVDVVAYMPYLRRRKPALDGGGLPADLGVVFEHVIEQQIAGAAEGQTVAAVVPVAGQQKMAVEQGDLRVVCKQLLVDAQLQRAAIPGLFCQLAQVSVGEIQVNERQRSADIPGGCVLPGHQAQPIWSAAVVPAVGAFEVGVLGIFRPKTTKCSGGRAVRGLQRGITFR